MSQKNTILAVFIAMLLLNFSLEGTAQNNSLDLTTQEKMLYRRGVETAVWAMPLTNTLAMRNGFKDQGCGFNNVAYFSEIQDYKASVTTPNNTTPYILSFWTLENGPVMIEIPAIENNVGLWGALMDVWQRPLADVGAKGRDKGKGAKYLIVPEGYTGQTYDADYVLTQKTKNGYTLLRPIIPDDSEKSMNLAINFTKKMKVYSVEKPKPTKHVDMANKYIDGVVHFDMSLFEMIADFIQEDKLEERDAVALGMLRGMGIEKGVEYTPSKREKEILSVAAKEAQEYLQDTYFDNSPKANLGNGWTVLTPATSYQTVFNWVVESGAMALDDRGSSYFAFFSSAEEFNLTNPPTMYLLTSRDANGDKLKGEHTYKFTVPANCPVNQFWSVLAYEYNDATFIDNVDKYGVASTEKLEFNADGSCDIYFGPTKPKDVPESNYVPTQAGEGWFPYFRFYGPKKELFQGKYQLSKIIKLNQNNMK
ncbi:DUF1214 domain-containing protein [Flammeovirga sp. SubArs3]|uniref:DUF1214 domain-containing protein n=1 Tax=Flammeovirga sp. SubArs3 TaxID=2995316 RepID=UPI00248B674E|nr:DUF1214 domain-containing protein [Flammeovirga sp. SubArs3]